MTTTPISCAEAWQTMARASATGAVRNYVQILDMHNFVVETDVFPRAALEAYSAWNLELDVDDEQRALFNETRGGAQGDYRRGMRRKIDNVVDCLSQFPASKRAVIAFANEPFATHNDDSEAKCLREIHLYIDDTSRLGATMFLRAQAAMLFPKNIHFVGSIMTEVASRLPGTPMLGNVFYVATVLVSDRH